MKLRRTTRQTDAPRLEILAPHGWVSLDAALAQMPGRPDVRCPHDAIALLALPHDVQAAIADAAKDVEPSDSRAARGCLPFEPRSFRDFMLYEAHAIDAARGFARRFMPTAARITDAYERVTRRTFPALKPSALWYRQPIYYFGNHLNFASDGEDISCPSYTRALDYELELGFFLAHPLRNATPDEAERAIGGFVILNDFSARDVQLAEMRSGFGPQKSKHFANAMSAVIVSADEILPRWRGLTASVTINGAEVEVAACTTAGARYTLGEALAHASRDEQLHPGELFGTGTLPGGSGIEAGRLLQRSDTVTLSIDGLGTLTNRIV